MTINLIKTSIFLFALSLCLLLLQQALFPSELTFATLLLSIFFGSMMIFLNKSFKMNPFLLSYLIFLFVILIYITIDYAADESIRKFLLYSMEFVSSIYIYNYLIFKNNVERFMSIYILISLISLIFLIILISPQNIINTRFGHNGSGSIVSYYIFNHPIYKSSNGTANICAIAMLFSAYFMTIKKDKRYFILFLFFLVCALLCGSRKGMLTVVLFILYFSFFRKKGITLKKVLSVIVLPILFGILIFKIPAFYNSIGFRVESFFGNLSGSNVNSYDGNSYLKRQQLKQIAYEWIDKKPIFGNGIGNFVDEIGYGAENNVLQILIDYGIFGLIIYYSFIFFLFKQIFIREKKTILYSMFSVIIISILIQDYGSVTYPWQQTTMWYSIFWAICVVERKKMLNEKEGKQYGKINTEPSA